MIAKTAVAIWFVLLCVSGGAQTGMPHRKPGTGSSAKATGFVGQRVSQFTSENRSALPEPALLDVLIATNEDCLFLVNGEVKGMALKDAFLYLKLPPGTYRYSAKSGATGDVHTDTFSVATQQVNEIFVDMLYAIDAGNEKRAKLKKESATSTKTAIQNKAVLQKEKSNSTTHTTKEREQKALHALMAGMVTINGGSFVMGNNRAPAADEAEHPVLLNTFSVGKYEVTQEQWEALMGSNPSLNRGCANCPVENVTWEEVMKFIRKLNSITGKKFRLPTEAEWEYVARLGGKAEIDKWGSVEAYVKNVAWTFVNSDHKTHPVGGKEPNVAGIYDLFGNVSEWCMDWYGAFFFKEDDTEKNPEGPPLGKEKIVRGGNYKDYVGDRFRPSFRNKMNPKSKGSEVGFRLVMEVQ